MLHVQVQKKKRGFAGYLLSFLIFFAVLFFSLFCMNAMQRRSEEESVDYLEEHYGIVIDRDRYHVFYDGWASNVMPDITVLPVAEEEKGDETW